MELRHFDPVIDASELIDIGQSDLQGGWKPRWDSNRLRTRIKILYGRKFALDGEKEYAVVQGTNTFDDIVPVAEKVMEIKTADYNIKYAEELRDHAMAITMFKQERVSINVLPLRFIESRPGDRIKVNVDRPWNSTDRIFEIEAVTVKIAKGGVDINVEAHNIYGLNDTVGGWTSDGAAAWSAATDDEKTEQGFWADDNGFIDSTDGDTRNRKVWY
jgi:hypothetical protein